MNSYYILLGMFVCGIIIGVAGLMIYEEISAYKIYNGLYLRNYDNKTAALNTVYNLEPSGNWVCVNIKGTNYKEMMKTCEHEVGHEIFAQKCAKDVEGCLNWSTTK